jgi:hypothetical protein
MQNAAQVVHSNTVISKTAVHDRLLPRFVNSTPEPCCGLHEWPFHPLRGGTELFAHAAFFVPRARTA